MSLVFHPVAAGTVYYALQQSDMFARLIVLVLFVISVYSWTVMIEKFLQANRVARLNRRFLEAYRRQAGGLALAREIDNYNGPLAQIYKTGLDEIAATLDTTRQQLWAVGRAKERPVALAAAELDRLQKAQEHCVEAEVATLESRLGNLGTVVTVSPFLGLLGTVWGVMTAFCGMAQAGRPDVRALAPGVSGALLTTVVGLVVAIPAVVGYNLLSNAVRRSTGEMDQLVEDMVGKLRLEDSRREPL